MGIPKGVNAFDYCARANIIATGGVDKVIRVWHPHIWSRPTGEMEAKVQGGTEFNYSENRALTTKEKKG